MIRIASTANPSYRRWRTLLTGRGVRKYGLTLAGGRQWLDVPASHHLDIVEAVLTEGDGVPLPSVIDSSKVFHLTPDLFHAFRDIASDGVVSILQVPDLPPFETNETGDGLLLCIPFQDPENVGSMLRTAALYGVERTVMLREAAHPFHPRAMAASGPEILGMPLFRGPSIERVDSLGMPVIGLDREGVSLDTFTFPETAVLLPGIEGPGIPAEVPVDSRVGIPLADDVESLNAAVAAAIVIHASRGKLTG